MTASAGTASLPSSYILQRGEFPYCIARRLDLDPAELLTMNSLQAQRVFFTGSVLQIPQTGRRFPGVSNLLTHTAADLVSSSTETLNSVIWVRQGKDTLALGNVTGAMVLQSMPLVAFGMLTTGWQLPDPALAAMAAALAGTVLGLIVLRHARYRPLPFIGCWTGLYLGGIASILAIT